MLGTLRVSTTDSTYPVAASSRPFPWLQVWVPAVTMTFGLLLVSDAISPVALILLQLFLAS